MTATVPETAPGSGPEIDLLVAGGLVAALLLVLPLPPPAVAVGMLVYACAAVVVAATAPRSPAGFGLANRVTLARLGGAAVFAGLAAAPDALAGAGGWAAAGGSAVLLALDAIDGRIARRRGLASAFGARFDMETDALTILVLSALALALGKAGPWILALGALRYAFVLAGRIAPRLARPLPESLRRKAVCALQIAVLTLLLAPPAVPPASSALALAALLTLVWSFAIDIRFLWSRP